MIYVISQIKFITELNLKFIWTGFFVVKNVGIAFLKIIIIPMAVQESQNKKYSKELNWKTHQIIKRVEFSIELNREVTNYYDL